jgi:carbon-monoxide dehydrogenase large subunit
MPGLGDAVPRIEDLRLVRGQGQYTDDVVLPKQIYASQVRSPHAHAKIRNIDPSVAYSVPGVLAVLTGKEALADGLKPIPHTLWSVHPADMRFPNRDGSAQLSTPHNILPLTRVRFAGEAVAMVLAETLASAVAGAEAVRVEYDVLACVTDAEAAADPSAPHIWDELSSNICVDAEIGDASAVERAFSSAPHVVRLKTKAQRVTGVPMEPRAALGEYDCASDRYTIITNAGGAFRLKQDVADILGIPHDKVRAIIRDVGGNFGTRGGFYPEQALVCWAAKRIGRPVKWVSHRSECFLSDYQARDVAVEAELALGQDGKFLALRGSVLSNVGAYATSLVTLQKSTQVMSGIYDVPVASFRARGVLTNTPPTRPYRATGRPEAMLVIERLIDLAAEECGFDRLDIRRRNLISPEQMPYRNPFGVVYDNGCYRDALDEVADLAAWSSFPGRREDSERRGLLRGIGIGTYVDTGTGVARERTELVITLDGFVDVTIGTVSNGQGHETTFGQLVCEWLQVPLEKVRFRAGDSDRLVHGGGSHSGRSMRLAALILQEATGLIIDRGKELASLLLEAERSDIEFRNGQFAVVGTDRGVDIFSLALFAAECPGLPDEFRRLSAESDQITQAGTYPYGGHVCEVEVDPETGTVRIARYTAIDDVGRAVNPLVIDGQTHGGIAQGLGQALWEHCHYDLETGQLLAGSFMDYAIPRASELPSYHTKISEIPATTHPLGIRGGGEGGTCPALAVVNNAVRDALRLTGMHELQMPLTPEQIWQCTNSRPSALPPE